MIPVDDESLRALLDNIPVGIGIAEPVEADGTIHQEARVVYYNKKWKEMFGFSTDEVKTVKQATGRLYPDPVVFAPAGVSLGVRKSARAPNLTNST